MSTWNLHISGDIVGKAAEDARHVEAVIADRLQEMVHALKAEFGEHLGRANWLGHHTGSHDMHQVATEALARGELASTIAPEAPPEVTQPETKPGEEGPPPGDHPDPEAPPTLPEEQHA